VKNLTRRRVVAGLGAFAGVSAAGCFLRKPLDPACLSDTRWSDPQTPLTIDTHSHIFNATDLPVKDFVGRVAAAQAGSTLKTIAELFGAILQDIGWSAAPDGATERARLKAVSPVLAQCGQRELLASAHADRAANYSAAVKELKASARRFAPKTAPDIPAQGDLQAFIAAAPVPHELGATLILGLSDTYQGPPSHQFHGFKKTLSSGLDFVVEMFQYRYTSLVYYLDTYSTGKTRKIDLLVSALVDYDWWLKDDPTKPDETPLPEQIEVMADLVAATQGRVHAYAPFCPLREIMHREHPTTTYSSLDFVRNSVERRGAIGVKLYPPMGFAPGGNAAVQKDNPDFWRRAPWLNPIARQSDFGAKLDAVLDELFAWCSSNGVPILAHANASVGAFPEFEELALAPHWDEPLASHPTLQVDFGHFGGAGVHSADFLARLSPRAGAPGSEAFVDASYFSEILDDEPKLRMILQSLFKADAAGAGVLKERLLYGTDWKMLMQEEDSGDYLERFEQLIIQIDPGKQGGSGSTALADAFFGRNAVHFLGLARNEPTRERLQRFYKQAGLADSPQWMSKVDALR
jgi:hypothetical protein